MPLIYHVTTVVEWNEAKQKGFYEAASVKQEGFIHCSNENQVQGVLERYFAGKKDLVKLVIDTDKLTSKFVHEWSPSTEDTFPHIYGVINLNAIIDVVNIN